MARGDQFWQPKVVRGDQIWQLKVVQADHFWLPKVVPRPLFDRTVVTHSESQLEATAGPEGGFKIPSAFLGRRKKPD